MQDTLSESLKSIKRSRSRKSRIVAILLVLSLIVSLDVFWVMRRPGVTLAGNADCQLIEHTHDGDCLNGISPCQESEHVHTIDCYSDKNADVESQLEWQNMFEGYPYTGDLRQDLVGIAKMQVGYSESKTNFYVGDDGVKRGYNRYGAWYGSPYSDWSAMFVSYCLHYAKADETEIPINSGADSMAELWKARGKYADTDDYIPKNGDLVFFTDNQVGIVVAAYESSFYVVRGDYGGEVVNKLTVYADKTIVGWGSTVGTIAENMALGNDSGGEANPPTISQNELLDISNGPAVFIFVGESEIIAQPKLKSRSTYTLTREGETPDTLDAAIDLLKYLEQYKGNYFFTLYDKNNVELPKDDNGNYVVQANTGYKMTLSFTSPNGFLPGTYEYQVPDGLRVDGGEGEFKLQDGTVLGDWVVTNDGLVTLNFNDEIASRTEITVSATLGINFKEQDEPIDFDGKIFITVQPPAEVKDPTQITKWGIQGAEGNDQDKTDETKIYWTILLNGHADSHIPGSIITDSPLKGGALGNHWYTDSDMDAGITIGVSTTDPETGAENSWHQWVVTKDDPNLTWTKDGWSYVMPEVATCQWCGALPLGSNYWNYYIQYSSTPDPDVKGTLHYMNGVIVEEQYAEGWAQFTQGTVNAVVDKEGHFVADASGGSFLWEIQATVPGRQPGERPIYNWYLYDSLEIQDENGNIIELIENEIPKATVTTYYMGNKLVVPHIDEAGPDDPFAWQAYWGKEDNGVTHSWQIYLLSKCKCKADSCAYWDGWCTTEYWYEHAVDDWRYNGYCLCWTETETLTFDFVYETKNPKVIEAYGGTEKDIVNRVEMFHKIDVQDEEGNTITIPTSVAWDKAGVDVPTMFEKSLMHDFDGYKANYKITVNEGKLVLTNGEELIIRDEMTDTLAFINGSLVITAEDANGNITTLKHNVDYTYTYDGTGTETDDNGKPVHVLNIVIKNPQPVTYILDYDATLIIPESVTDAVKYNNSATIYLWGTEISDTTVEKVYADINIAAKNFKVDLVKADAVTGEPLQGATFGLFNEEGGLVASGVTDANGKIHFKTDVTQGIILREHVLYYMQELQAPIGYRLDKTKHWFCFCDTVDGNCTAFDELAGDKEVIRIPFEQIGIVHIDNHVLDYDLPATGGSGKYPLMLASVTLIVIPLVYRFTRRRRRERRGVD